MGDTIPGALAGRSYRTIFLTSKSIPTAPFLAHSLGRRKDRMLRSVAPRVATQARRAVGCVPVAFRAAAPAAALSAPAGHFESQAPIARSRCCKPTVFPRRIGSLRRFSQQAASSSDSSSNERVGGPATAEESALWRSLLDTPNPQPGQYAAMHRASLERPDAFWRAASDLIHWHSKGARVLRPAAPGQKPWEYTWFPADDGKEHADANAISSGEAPLPEPAPGRWTLNAAENMLDVHVRAGHGDRTAIIYDSAVQGQVERISYSQLLERVSKLAGALRHAGVKAGDRVLFYMPMIPQAVEGMLACARLGAIHAVVFGGEDTRTERGRFDD